MNSRVSCTEWSIAKDKLAAGKQVLERLEKVNDYNETDETKLFRNLIEVCETLFRAIE